MTARLEVVAIGEKLIEVGSSGRPLNLSELGRLLKRLALVYGRLVNTGKPVSRFDVVTRSRS